MTIKSKLPYREKSIQGLVAEYGWLGITDEWAMSRTCVLDEVRLDWGKHHIHSGMMSVEEKLAINGRMECEF
jgi:hypothetical protein